MTQKPEAPKEQDRNSFWVFFLVSVAFAIFAPTFYSGNNPVENTTSRNFFENNTEEMIHANYVNLTNTFVSYRISEFGGGISSIQLENNKIGNDKLPISIANIKSDRPHEMIYQYPDMADSNPTTFANAMVVCSEDDPTLSTAKYSIVKATQEEVLLICKHRKGTIFKSFFLDPENPYRIQLRIDIEGFENDKLWISSGAPSLDAHAPRGTSNLVKTRAYDALTENGYRGKTSVLSSSDEITLNPQPYTGWISNQNGMFSLILDAENPAYVDKNLIVRIPKMEHLEKSSAPFWDWLRGKFKTTYILNGMMPISKPKTKWAVCAVPLSHDVLASIDKQKALRDKDHPTYSSIKDNNGLLSFVVQPVAGLVRFLLLFINEYCDNWILAVIITTFLVRLALTPVVILSIRHRFRVKMAQPLISQIQATHGNTADTGAKVMEAYKKYNANPWALLVGALVQIPIFLSTFEVFSSIFEIRGEALTLFGNPSSWIYDLSKPDCIELPFSMPIIGNTLSILPLFVVIGIMTHMSLFGDFGQKYTRALFVLPCIPLTMIFYSSPAILCIYIGFSGLLSVLQNKLLTPPIEQAELALVHKINEQHNTKPKKK